MDGDARVRGGQAHPASYVSVDLELSERDLDGELPHRDRGDDDALAILLLLKSCACSCRQSGGIGDPPDPRSGIEEDHSSNASQSSFRGASKSAAMRIVEPRKG